MQFLIKLRDEAAFRKQMTEVYYYFVIFSFCFVSDYEMTCSLNHISYSYFSVSMLLMP